MKTSTDRERFEEFARDIRRLAIALTNVSAQPIRHDSQAKRDLGDHRYDGTWGELGREVSYRAGIYFMLATDHLRAVAALTLTDRIVMAQFTAARGALEALAHLYWLYDPAVTFEERIRRHLNLRLESAAEMMNLLSDRDHEAVPSVPAETTIDEIRSSAFLLPQFTYHAPSSRNGFTGPGRLGERLPRIMTLIDEMVQMEEGGVPFGRLIYRYYSSIAHAGDHTIGNWVMASNPTAVEGVVHARFGITLQRAALWLLPLLIATNSAVERVGLYRGWNLSIWSRIHLEVSGRWLALAAEEAVPDE